MIFPRANALVITTKWLPSCPQFLAFNAFMAFRIVSSGSSEKFIKNGSTPQGNNNWRKIDSTSVNAKIGTPRARKAPSV